MTQKEIREEMAYATLSLRFSDEIIDTAEVVIKHLNKKVRNSFNYIKVENIELVRDIIAAGYTLEDIITVIDDKGRKWGENSCYMRPNILFNLKDGKFQKFLEESNPAYITKYAYDHLNDGSFDKRQCNPKRGECA